jgi:polyisoprenoid-binding protein YceI
MTTATATDTWTIDPTHSAAEFTVKHLAISKVRGSFTKFSGTIVTPAGGHVPIKVSAQIDVASISTAVEDRDNHLRSADFFHVEAHPHITFESTAVHQHDDEIDIEGDLTIRGITRKVTLETDFEGEGADPWGNDRIAFVGSTKINRKDFGLTWHQTLEKTGALLVGDDIKIEITIEAVKNK